jgi:membrane associated rhomboid family serine protease
MIIPWIRGLLGIEKAPMTWMLVFVNVFFYLLCAESNRKAEMAPLNQDLPLTGHYYQIYLQQKGVFADEPTTETQWSILGAKALRDPGFLSELDFLNAPGDQIQLQNWKLSTQQFFSNLKKRNSWIFGLHAENQETLSWVTYQFVHANILHLVSNMVMLLIFGAALEAMVGGWVVIALYFIFGVFGGIGYFVLSPNSNIPVIGASAAVSGLILFYTLSEIRQRVPFFYIVTPLEGHYGWIYLSKWFLIPLLFVGDFKDYFSSPDEIVSQIAVSAHIGGLFGALGLYILIRSKSAAQSIFANRARL